MRNITEVIDTIVQSSCANLVDVSSDLRIRTSRLAAAEIQGSLDAVHAVTSEHPLHLEIDNSLIPGSYILGKCIIQDSILWKTDVRGDELKLGGAIVDDADGTTRIIKDEVVLIQNSLLLKTLVHSNSHDPDNPEEFLIRNSIAMPYANVHGSRLERTFLKPFATIDLTNANRCVIGTCSYVQTGKLEDCCIDDGVIWIDGDAFQFCYKFHPQDLNEYISLEYGGQLTGIISDFVNSWETALDEIFISGRLEPSREPQGSFISPYAVVKGNCCIGENVFVSQRACLENAWLGKGANVQENCAVVESTLEGNNVSAHGSKMIHSRIGRNVFIGFNSFLRGRPGQDLVVGEGCIIAPHTIIDPDAALDIPAGHLVWGCIRDEDDLALHSISLDNLARVKGDFRLGSMIFRGDGEAFVKAFRDRIELVLELNGAFYSGSTLRGHAQKCRGISFNRIEFD